MYSRKNPSSSSSAYQRLPTSLLQWMVLDKDQHSHQPTGTDPIPSIYPNLNDTSHSPAQQPQQPQQQPQHVVQMGGGSSAPANVHNIAPAAPASVHRDADDDSKQGMPSVSCLFSLSNTKIKVLNRIAFTVHLAMCGVAIYGRYRNSGGQGQQGFKLKYDRVHLVGKGKAPNGSAAAFATSPFVQLASPYYPATTTSASLNASSAQANQSLSETCGAAVPNVLEFAGSQNFTMEMWTYPKKSGLEVDLGWCVAAFFLLSFLFQMSLELIGASGLNESFQYDKMFDGTMASDAQDEFSMKKAFAMRDARLVKPHMLRRLHFNWWRFVEYSASGSLVLITIAFLAGIMDVELIVCMFVLAATCMLLGIVAEFALRARLVLEKTVEYCRKNTEPSILDRDLSRSKEEQNPLQVLEPVLKDIYAKLSYCFWVSHLLGWVCIIVPWAIVVLHYMAWWSPCSADTLNLSREMLNRMLNRSATAADALDTAANPDTTRKPPDFVMVGFFVSLVLLMVHVLIDASCA